MPRRVESGATESGQLFLIPLERLLKLLLIDVVPA
jgi:hypothetical protein